MNANGILNYKNSNNRESNFELMRIVLMFMILILHTNYPLVESNVEKFSIRFLTSLSIVSVNCFIFISGYFGIKTTIQSITKYILHLTFYILILGIIGYLYGIKNLLEPWWFAITYFQLMLLTPFLNKCIDKLTKKEHVFFIVALCYLNFYSGFVRQMPYFKSGFCLSNFICIYVIARYLRTYKITLKLKYSLILYILTSITCAILYVYVFKSTPYACKGLCDYYNSPLIFLSSILFFFIFINIRINCNLIINTLAVYVFSVYLISNHPFTKEIVYPVIWKYVNTIFYINAGYNIFTYLIVIIVVNIFIFMLCIVLDIIRKLVTDRILIYLLPVVFQIYNFSTNLFKKLK